MYRVAIFDFDGTLAHTLEDVVACMHGTFEAFGEESPSEAHIRGTMGMSLEAAFSVLRHKEMGGDEVALWVRRYRWLYASQGGLRTRLYPGVLEALARFSDAGVWSVVVSNKGRDAIESALLRLGIAETVRCVFAADGVRYKKPDRRLYTEEIKTALPGVVDSSVLVVGDSESDLRFARNAKLRCCWAAYGYGNRKACLGLYPDMVIQRFEDLSSALLGA